MGRAMVGGRGGVALTRSQRRFRRKCLWILWVSCCGFGGNGRLSRRTSHERCVHESCPGSCGGRKHAHPQPFPKHTSPVFPSTWFRNPSPRGRPHPRHNPHVTLSLTLSPPPSPASPPRVHSPFDARHKAISPEIMPPGRPYQRPSLRSPSRLHKTHACVVSFPATRD